MVKDLVKRYNVIVFTIIKPKVNGSKIMNRIRKTGFEVLVKVDVVNYLGGI